MNSITHSLVVAGDARANWGLSRLAVILGALLCLIASPALCDDTIVTTTPYLGVTLISRNATSPRAEHMHIVQIDLTAPGIHFELSPATPPSPPGTNGGVTNETSGQKTIDFMNQVHAQVAINAEFFGNPLAGNGGTYLTGFAASLGNVYSSFEASPTLSYAITPNAPGINIDASNNAQVVVRGSSAGAIAAAAGGGDITPYNTVTGSAQIITNGSVTIPTYNTAGGVLIPDSNGTTYHTGHSWYDDGVTNARTSIGLSQDGHTLYLFTVDNAGGSSGMTVKEMANFLSTNYGVWNALNLDGGGSTTMSWVNPANSLSADLTVTSNGASDRSVGASLALFASPVPEPSTAALLAVGAGLLLARRRRGRGGRVSIGQVATKRRSSDMIRSHHVAGTLLAASLLLGGAGSANAGFISIPYNQNFTSGAGDFTTGILTSGSSTATWTPNTGSYTAQLNRVSGASAYAYSSASVPSGQNLSTAANSSFYLSTVMESIGNTVPGSVNATVGLRFLADTTNSNNSAFVVDMNIGNVTGNAGRVRAVEWANGAAGIVDPSPTQGSQPQIAGFNLAHKYQLEVKGLFDSSDKLDLWDQVTDLTTSTVALAWNELTPTTHYTLPTNVAAELNYGFFMSTSSGANSTITTTFDNLTIAVPEPSGLCLVLAASLLVTWRRRGTLRG